MRAFILGFGFGQNLLRCAVFGYFFFALFSFLLSSILTITDFFFLVETVGSFHHILSNGIKYTTQRE